MLVASGAALATLAGCSSLTNTKGSASIDAPKTTPSGPGTSGPLPSSPNQHTYATMGRDDAAVDVTYVGNWKCPYCDQFEESGFFPTLVSKYVATGKAQLTYRALAYGPKGKKPFLGSDSPRAARAGLAIWHTEPEKYWEYHAYAFANQPSEKKQWATTANLVTFAKRVGCSSSTISTLKSALNSSKYEPALQQTVQYAGKHNLNGTPYVIINDSTVLNPLKPKQVKQALSSALNQS